MRISTIFPLGVGLVGISILAFQVADNEQGAVAGSIYTQLNPGADRPSVSLPGITVFVRNLDTGAIGPQTKTIADGRYQIAGLTANRYEICWKAPGWVADCRLDPVVVSGETEFLDPIAIMPEGPRTMLGNVRLGDGSGCAFSDSLFQVKQNASVSAVDSSGRIVSGPVPVNSAGLYVLPDLPNNVVRVRATCAGGLAEAPLAGALFASGSRATLDLTLSSFPPRFTAMTARLAGHSVKSVPPGATIEVAVEAQTGDASRLDYQWAVSPDFGSIVSTGGNHAYWTAPAAATEGRIRVLVSNGRGGLAHGGILMMVGAVELGTAVVDPPAYALQVVTDGMNPNREYIPPYSGYVKGQNSSSFLTERTNSGSTAVDYYKVVVGADYQTPAKCGNGKRCTLGGWLKANGWNEDGTVKDKKEARTAFLNNNDLGYVRDMHCRVKATDGDMESEVACWVTNYSKPANQEVPGPPFAFPAAPSALDLGRDFGNAERMDPTTADASVCMEYRKIQGVNGGNPIVTFIAYGKPVGGQLKAAPISEGSDQDGFGDKPVPGMCNNCHGGNSFAGAANTRGSFIVFDLSTFIFSKDQNWKRADLEPAFKRQHQAVLATNPPAAVRELIQGWYGGAALPNATADDRFVPTAWVGQEKLYRNVVRVCRTCHTPLQNQRNSFRTYAQLQARTARIADRVCGAQADRDMPHDAISYLNFWRFKPPDLPPDYPLGGKEQPVELKIQQPFMDMGAFLAANGESVGACKNSKGR